MGSNTFGINTAKEKYDEFLEEYFEYKENETSIRKATNLATNSWHLVDWTFEEYKTVHYCKNIGEYRKSLYPCCQSLKIMHDIANASKHKQLQRPKAFLKNTKKHIGPFSRIFSSEFDQTHLEIELENGKKLNFEREIDKVKLFWDNYFQTELH